MSSASRSIDRSTRTDRTTGVVDVSGMTAAELKAFVGADPGFGTDVRIQRRGSSTYLLAE